MKNIDRMLLILAFTVIFILVFQKNAWVAILPYWIVNTVKTGIVAYKSTERKVTNTVIAVFALSSAVILMLQGNPWLSISLYWIIIVSSIKKSYETRDNCLIVMLTVVAINVVSLTYVFGGNTWIHMLVYWSLIGVRLLVLQKPLKQEFQ